MQDVRDGALGDAARHRQPGSAGGLPSGVRTELSESPAGRLQPRARRAAAFEDRRRAGCGDDSPQGRQRGDRQSNVRRRLRRCTQHRARVHRSQAAGRGSRQGLGCHGPPGGHRLPRHPIQGHDPVRQRGNILLIPREGGYMVRLYVDMGEIAPDAWLTADEVLDQARRVLAPYTLEVKEIAWFSVYRVGHRVTDKFDDVDDDKVGTRSPRVFIAGDACHTHTAKAGQGMNVSMQDTFNLGWKLAAVLQGRSPAALLDTYSLERKQIAEDLIAMDTRWSQAIGGAGRVDPDDPKASHGCLRRGPAPVRHQRRVHRRTGHAVPSRAAHRRRRPPPPGARLPAGAPVQVGRGHPPRRRQARPPRARAPRRRPVAALRLRRRRRPPHQRVAIPRPDGLPRER